MAPHSDRQRGSDCWPRVNAWLAVNVSTRTTECIFNVSRLQFFSTTYTAYRHRQAVVVWSSMKPCVLLFVRLV